MENDAQRPRFTMSLRRFRQIAIVTVAGVCFLTIAGSVVRLTGSGLGCDDWPACNNERFIDVSTGHAAIEQLNRLLSGVIGVPTLLLAVGSFRVWPRRPGLRGPALAVLVTILANGVVGGLAVLGSLHPMLVQSHFLLAMASIGFGMIAVHRARPEPAADAATIRVTPPVTLAVTGLVLAMVVTLVTGTVVTGAGPHAGDETARRFGFDISTVAQVHSVTVWATVALFLVLVVALHRSGLYRRFQTELSTWMFLAVLQGGVGYMQYFNGIPAALVVAHVALATALWVSTMRLALAVLDPVAVTPSGPTFHALETMWAPTLPVRSAPRA
jgi:heme a synthase